MKQKGIIGLLLMVFLSLYACSPETADPAESGPPAIPDSAVKEGFSLYQNHVIADVCFYRDGTYADLAHNASFRTEGSGMVEPVSVTHQGITATIPGYRNTGEDKQAMGVDLSAYAEEEAFQKTLSGGYSIEAAVQYTEEPGNRQIGIFSSTQNGMFGLWFDNGFFKFQHFDTDYRTVFGKEKIRIGELYHLMGVYDAEKNQILFYVNGQLQNTLHVSGLTFGESPFIYVIGADIGTGKTITDYAAGASIYTKAALYSGALTEQEVQQAYQSFKNVITDPQTLENRGSAEVESYIMRDVVLTGEAAAGNTMSITGTLENHTDTDRTFKVKLERPLLMTHNAHADQLAIVVEAQGSADFKYDFTIQEGGSGLCSVQLLTKSNKILSQESFRLIADGKGYYVGDAHTHSTLSDGHSPLKDNFLSVYHKGHAWILTTEHNCNPGNKAFARAAAKGLTDFIPIVGNEITTNYGHMLEYNTTYMHPAGYTGGMWEIMAAIRPTVGEWQEIMDTIIEEGGLCYIAHPFYTGDGRWIWPGVGTDPTKVDYYTGFTGIEVYNEDGHNYRRHSEWTDDAFEWWDRYNLKGEQHYYGICNTDGHTDQIVGTAGNAVLINELNEENIIQALKNGTFYGTNGPELRFSISGAGNGQSLLLPENGTATVKIRAADQYSTIKKVVLYRYTIGGDVDTAYKNREVKVLYEDAKGSKGAHLFEYSQKIDVAENEFYRVEVYTQHSLFGDSDYMGGFAFSNPVWIVK